MQYIIINSSFSSKCHAIGHHLEHLLWVYFREDAKGSAFPTRRGFLPNWITIVGVLFVSQLMVLLWVIEANIGRLGVVFFPASGLLNTLLANLEVYF